MTTSMQSINLTTPRTINFADIKHSSNYNKPNKLNQSNESTSLPCTLPNSLPCTLPYPLTTSHPTTLPKKQTITNLSNLPEKQTYDHSVSALKKEDIPRIQDYFLNKKERYVGTNIRDRKSTRLNSSH